MKKIGFAENSFTSTNVNLALLALFVWAALIYAILLSPDHAGFIETNLNTELRMDFVNVGEGDSILIRTPKGRTFLVDGGSNVTPTEAKNQRRNLIQNYLYSMNIRNIDGIVITHWHNDHLGGIVSVLKLFQVGVIYEVPAGVKTDVYHEYENLCKKHNIKRISIKAGMKLEWGDELFAQVLHPEDTYASDKNSEIHDDSVVIALRYGKVQTLLCGDVEEDGERELLKYNDTLKSQIIKIPNHGADISANKSFLEMVGANAAIVSVGWNNPFKYPGVKTLETLENIGTKVYRTDVDGNILVTIGGREENDFKITVDR